MRQVNKSIEIGASGERILEFLTTPANLPGVWPHLVDVTNVERKNDGWNSFDWTYKMAGVRFHGKAKTARIEPGRYFEAKNEGGIPSVFRWRFEKLDDSTRMNLDIEYTIPGVILGRLAEPLVAKMNEREIETLLANVKSTLELEPTAKVGDAAKVHGQSS